MKPRWKIEEIDILKKYYRSHGSKYCATLLPYSRAKIRLKAYRLNINNEPDIDGYKICMGCFKKKLLSEFSPNIKCQFGVQSKCKICRAKWESNRKKTDKTYRVLHAIRNRIRMAIKTNVKRGKSLELLGCSIHELKCYLTSKFQTGMTWENHGLWHIDHIIPCNNFDMSKTEEQKKCFHFSNLQPLWAKDNLSKGCK